VTYEQGKTLADARGDVFRGLGVWFTASQTPAACTLTGAAARHTGG
jgi:hypothetical protein